MLAPDTILQNRYRILEQLDEGGMGAIYLAEDKPPFKSKVVLKRNLFIQPQLRQAFEHEARLLYGLHHNALPRVTDYFIEDEQQYLVMDFIAGRDLERLLVERLEQNRGPFPVGKVLRWADRLLEALEYLHERPTPIIHRDIKPQNLKLTPKGEIMLLDFGLAKGAVTGMSQPGASIPGCTRNYAPLEQMTGQGTDARSDLYSLAATLYRLMTGEVPPDALARRAAIAYGHPDPLRPADELNRQVPAAVAAVLSHALALHPDERPATAAEMRKALPAGSADSFPAGEARQEIRGSATLETAPQLTTKPVAPLERTYAGQSTASSLHFVSEAPSGIVAARRSRLKMTIVASVALSVLLTPGFIWYLGKSSQPPPPAPRVELLAFTVETKTAGGKTVPIADEQPIVVDEWFRFRFSSRQSGYLYILAPNEKGIVTAFLTAQPDADWGEKTNRIEDGGKFILPRPEKWLRLKGIETYTLIFALTPLAEPRFLTGKGGVPLTEPEQLELGALRKQFGNATQINRQGDQFVVTMPAPKGNDAPVLFDIVFKRRDSGAR